MPVFNYSHSGFWQKYLHRMENMLLTHWFTDSYTLSISIFLFHVVKNRCDCSEINLLRRCHCKTHRISFCHPTSFFFNRYQTIFYAFLVWPLRIFMSFVHRLHCFNYVSVCYLLALAVHQRHQNQHLKWKYYTLFNNVFINYTHVC